MPRDRSRRRPSPEFLECRALMAVGFSELPIEAPSSFVTGGDGNFYFIPNFTDRHGQYDQVDRITVAGNLTKFTIPSHFAVDQVAKGPDGNVWFTDSGTIPTVPYNLRNPVKTVDRIGRITTTGEIAEFSLHKESDPSVDETVGDIEPGLGGDVWFVDYREPISGGAITTLIGRLAPSGQITLFNAPGAGASTEIVGGADGKVYYTEPGAGVIGRLSPTGAVTQVAVPGKLAALSITAGPDGNVWFTEEDGVGRVTPGGTVTLFSDPNLLDRMNRITAGPDGNVWFTEEDGVGRVTPGGIVSNFDTPQAGDFPSLIGIGPQHALLFTYETHDDHLVSVATDATATPPSATATAETSDEFEALATRVAHFTGSDPMSTLADYRAVVHYAGEQDQSAQGIIVPDPSGGYNVYVLVPAGVVPTSDAAGTFPATVTIFDTRHGAASETTVNGFLALKPANPPPMTFNPGVSFAANGEATATGSIQLDGQLPASTESATINFGDRTPAVAASVTAQVMLLHPDVGFFYYATTFTATAPHHYVHAGGYTITIAFRDKSGNIIQNDTLAVFAG